MAEEDSRSSWSGLNLVRQQRSGLEKKIVATAWSKEVSNFSVDKKNRT